MRDAEPKVVGMNVPSEMTVTIAQAQTLYKKWAMTATVNDMGKFPDFLSQVAPTIGCDGAVTVQWCKMWLCIEKDGYCHT